MLLFAAPDNLFIQNLLTVVGIIFAIGAIPALVKYIIYKIGNISLLHKDKPGKQSNPLEKYQYCTIMRANARQMLFDALLKKVSVFALLVIGFIMLCVGALNPLGLPKNIADIVGTIGVFVGLGFFAVYVIRFLLCGGWQDAGAAFDSWYKQYKAPEYETEERWERWDGGAWELKSSITRDKNADYNMWTWVFNLFVTIIKICMLITYVILFILEDIYIVIKHVIFYKAFESYYHKKAKGHYIEFVEKAADLDCFKICDKLYADDKYNDVAHEVHREYLRNTLLSIKKGANKFVAFASDLSVDKWYTVTRVNKRVTSEKYGDKTIYAYSGNGCRVFICAADKPNVSNPLEFFAHAFPTYTTDDEYLASMLGNEHIMGYIRLYQNIYLRYLKKSGSPDKAYKFYKIGARNRSVSIIEVAPKDVVVHDLPELTEESAPAEITDATFYEFSNYKVLHELSLEIEQETTKEEQKTREVREDGEYSVHIIECGEQMVEVIKTIRRFSDAGIAQVKKTIQNAPASVLDAVSLDSANHLVEALAAVGAKAEVRETPEELVEKIIEERKAAAEAGKSAKSDDEDTYKPATDLQTIKSMKQASKISFFLSAVLFVFTFVFGTLESLAHKYFIVFLSLSLIVWSITNAICLTDRMRKDLFAAPSQPKSTVFSTMIGTLGNVINCLMPFFIATQAPRLFSFLFELGNLSKFVAALISIAIAIVFAVFIFGIIIIIKISSYKQAIAQAKNMRAKKK